MATSRSGNKSAAAFRTISEVSDELQVPQHVLRFWETKFDEVSPMKRGGGRRYYRPEDIELLRRIRDLLYADGYTIKGVQKLLREGQVTPPGPEEALNGTPEGQVAAAPGKGSGGGKAAKPAKAQDTGKDGGGAGLSDEQRRRVQAVLDDLVAARETLRQPRS